MYTDDFVALVRRYANPSSHIHFVKTRFGPLDVASILDYSYPRRSDPCVTGHMHFDWYTSSYIANFTIPEQTEYGIEGKWIEEARTDDGINPAHWGVRPITGYIDVLVKLLTDGVVIPSATLDKLMRKDTRSIADTPFLRLLYAK